MAFFWGGGERGQVHSGEGRKHRPPNETIENIHATPGWQGRALQREAYVPEVVAGTGEAPATRRWPKVRCNSVTPSYQIEHSRIGGREDDIRWSNRKRRRLAIIYKTAQ